jgi:hypothetical protein
MAEAPKDQPAAENGRRHKKVGQREEFETIQLNMLPMMALFTIILCYLLKSYSTDPVQITPTPGTLLPKSSTDLAPQEAVQVAISDRVILVEDQKVADVANGRVAAEFKKDRNPASMYIPPLYDALKKAGDKQKMFARYNKKKQELQFKGLLTIIADKRIPFRLLTEVLYTAGQAEYGAYKFAVIKEEEQ